MARSLPPDTLLELSLNGTARRLAVDSDNEKGAIAELRAIANGRADLLGHAAGGILGGYLAQPGMSHPAEVRAASLLILAGADPRVIQAAAQQAWTNVERGIRPPAPSTTPPASS